MLENDEELKNKLPIKPESNVTLIINSAKFIGCFIEATFDDVLNEKRKLDVDLLYQVLKPIVYKKISVQEFPQMLRFKQEKRRSRRIKSALDIDYLLERANKVLENSPKLGANIYIKNVDIPSGNEHLNRFFSAKLFMANHGMGEATQKEKMLVNKLLDGDEEGDHEEGSLKMINKIKPGTVNWKIAELKNLKNPFKVSVNCQEAIDASKRSGYKIVSIGNKDIQEGRKKHILAIVWQLMRAYTLKIIGERIEEELIEWANSKVSDERKIKNIKEKKLSDGLFWIDLLASIEPRSIRWDFAVKENPSNKDREMNAKYALSVARGLGAMIFVIWEDITKVKSNFLLTFLASLYDVSQTREKTKNDN